MTIPATPPEDMDDDEEESGEEGGATQARKSLLALCPAAHRMHRSRVALGMAEGPQATQREPSGDMAWPGMEHGSHVSRSILGTVPGSHGVHSVSSALKMVLAAHATHAVFCALGTPAGAQSTHAERCALGTA